MNDTKTDYIERNIDYFTNEYYENVSKLSGSKLASGEPSSYFNNNSRSFRENIHDSLYGCLGLEIVYQSHCQLKCNFCFVDRQNSDEIPSPLSLSQVVNIVDQACAIDNLSNKKLFNQIVFIGGEPTLNPELDKMINYVVQKGLTPIIVTNGVKLADLEYAKKISLPKSNVVIRIPFRTEEGQDYLDKITGVKGYSKKLQKAVENLLKLKQDNSSMEIIGHFVLNNETKKYAKDVYTYCRQNDILPICERMRLSDDNISNLSLVPNPDDIKDLMSELHEYDKKNFSHLIHGEWVSNEEKLISKIRYFLTPTVNNPCTMVKTGLHIKYTSEGFGNVISCCGQNIIHGNIENLTLQEIVEEKAKSKIFVEQEKYVYGPCSSCELYHLAGCEGGCRGNANHSFNCPRASDPQCIFIREEFRKSSDIMKPSCSDCKIDLCKTNSFQTNF